MEILEEALAMLEKHPLCDNCLGRQFALLGYGVENAERGKTVKLVLAFKAHELELSKNKDGVRILKILAENGLHEMTKQMLQKMKKHVATSEPAKECFLCRNRLKEVENLAKKAVKLLEDYEYRSFLVGIELPTEVEEREDEFKAEFEIDRGESLRNEFGRLIGKQIAKHTGKEVEFSKPEVVVLANPFTGKVTLQVNPLFVAGRYRKLVRDIPQSRWFCSDCRGRGCKKCNWTGKMYPESVEEIVEKPFLEVTRGIKASFHASGREDIDARMLGRGRPFVVEITRPVKRFFDLKSIEEAVNVYGKNKVKISGLKFADKSTVRKLKKAESTQKEYRLTIEFENAIADKDMRLLEDRLTRCVIEQRTPKRVLHRRADLTREKYIYDVKVKKMSSRKAEMRVRCQGGLYVKELVTGDDGRTAPSVSEILGNQAKPLKLDVLNIIMKE
ncbi:MAG: tRNA pseudouridine(54/55) synthase Pus10 [Candidatus Bathyarchaeota archaeon]|nr:tRNA pseudouridine(54/55) synthase Pus10 [Candidatus Bathyarchaeota archaeon]